MSSDIFRSLILGLSVFSISLQGFATPTEKVPRPDQYVMIGFDGGLNLTHWETMHQFTQDMNTNHKPLSFTYFVSSVYFLQQSNRMLYFPPHHSQGYSMISFGDNNQGISDRVDMMNKVYLAGDDIGSHACGHFPADVEKWTLDDWTSEFTQYKDLVFNAFNNNKMTPNNRYPGGFAFENKDIEGFRAPYLGSTADLFTALKNFGFKYDASTTGDMGDWPRKDATGIWRFQVPLLTIAGTAKKSLGMDYNFYWVQSQAKEDLANRELYRKQMYDTYMNYFQTSYYGNRGPVFLGHHFVLYNGGAYWDALKDFANNVCGLPEVKCINYKQYEMWIDGLTPDLLHSYRAGHFDKLAKPANLTDVPAPVLDVKLSMENRGDIMRFKGSGTDYVQQGLKTQIMVNSKSVPGASIRLQDLRRQFPHNSDIEVSARVLNQRGEEIQRITHIVKNLGTDKESVMATPEEAKALVGDMPEAHRELP